MPPGQAERQSLESLDKGHMICYPFMPVYDDLVPATFRINGFSNRLRAEAPQQMPAGGMIRQTIQRNEKTKEATAN
jgi:hypothetical protein